MRGSKVLLSVSLALGVATAGAVGCGSSKSATGTTSSTTTGTDSGSDGAVAAGAYGSNCSPIGGGSCAAQQGLTCCVDLLAALSDPAALGTCVEQSQCTSTVQYACSSPSDCSGGQSCCGGFSIEAGLFPAFGDAGDASFDAAALLAAEDDSGGAGAGGGLPAALMGITLESFCQASCAATQITLCGADSDCASGTVCTSPVAALGGLFGGAGASTSGVGGDAGILGLMTCQPADAGGVAPIVESGAPVAEAAAPAADAAVSPDAAPVEAAAPGDGAPGD
jgi:hypothetical protein